MQHKILIYSREPIKDYYSHYLANSVHLAYSEDGKNYQALNNNYGILFAKATVDKNNVINPKSLTKPFVFSTNDAGFGIVAIQTNADGSNDEESKGKVLLWLSKNLVDFEEKGLIDLKTDLFVKDIFCQYNLETKNYQIDWLGEDGKFYRNTLSDLKGSTEVSLPEQVQKAPFPSSDIKDLIAPEGAIKGNSIGIDKELSSRILTEWMPLENIAIEVPKSVEAKSLEELSAVTATAVYTDGSTASKKIRWDLQGVDFNGPGSYEVTGTVVQEKYNFPLAIGYADPIIARWDDKYYFVATNDHVNNIGIYVRESSTVKGFFGENVVEHLILDKDESRGLVQTFWAPEFHIVNDQMYLFFAVSGMQWGPQCHIMQLKPGGKITEPNDWNDPIRVIKKDGTPLANDGITLDMTYFEVEGVSYVVWSYRSRIGHPEDTGSMLYIATIDPEKPWQLTSEPVLLSRPLYGWENIDGTINNEGAYPLVMDDKVYITYSGGAANGYTYALGLLTAERGKDLLRVNNWKKSPTPVLSYDSIEGEYGPGHNGFYKNEMGDIMITYHAEPVIRNHMRSTGIRRVHFDINNKPRFDMSFERDLNREFTTVKVQLKVT